MRAPFQVIVVAYRRIAGRLEIAVLHRSDYDLWQFVSGGGEDSELPLETARREGREEASIPESLAYEPLASRAMVPASWFDAWAHWPAELLVIPEHAFAVDVGPHELVISDEHRELRWLTMDQALATLRFDSNKTALWELHERLYPGPRIKRHAFDVKHDGRCPCS